MKYLLVLLVLAATSCNITTTDAVYHEEFYNALDSQLVYSGQFLRVFQSNSDSAMYYLGKEGAFNEMVNYYFQKQYGKKAK